MRVVRAFAVGAVFALLLSACEGGEPPAGGNTVGMSLFFVGVCRKSRDWWKSRARLHPHQGRWRVSGWG